MERESLSSLNIQDMWLSHCTTKITVNSRAYLGRNIRDDGDKVELLFPFSEKNGELTNIAFGVDYEIEDNKPIGATKIEIIRDGTYSVLTQVPVQIISVENAVARVGDDVVQILDKLDDSSSKAIAFDPTINRFARTSDLRNQTIELFRAEAVYPRWVEVKRRVAPMSFKNAAQRIEEVPLEHINLNLTMLKDGVVIFRQYLATVNYIPHVDRRFVIQPSDARRITLHNLSLRVEQILNAAS